jgi:hypothetical protein
MTLCLHHGCGDFFSNIIFTDPNDNTAACLTISPGSEVAVRVAVGGKPTKLFWITDGTRLDFTDPAVTVLRLIATNANDGFAIGDTDARLELTLRREDGIAVGDYIDTTFIPNQQSATFDVRLSSSPTNDSVATQQATGRAEITEISRNGNNLRVRVKFALPVLNLVDVQIDEICGEAFFNGPITIVGDENG